MSEQGRKLLAELVRLYEGSGLSPAVAIKRAYADVEEAARTGKLPEIMSKSRNAHRP